MKQATVVRLFLLGLPIGLIVTTAASMVWHFNKPGDDGPPKIYTTLADEITESTLSGYIRNLSTVIGERHSSNPEALERTANYLESTLGTRNLGYDVRRQDYEVDGTTARNLWVEIPGGKRLNDVVLAVAHYDAPAGSKGENDNASGVAALLAMAENFSREKPMLTMRLGFLTHGTAPYLGTEDSGGSHFAQLLVREGDQIQGIFCLDGIGAYPKAPMPSSEATRAFLPENGPFLSLLANNKSAPLLTTSFDRLAPLLPFTTHQAIVPENAQALLDNSLAGAFLQAGMPTLLVRGNGRFSEGDSPVDSAALATTTRALSTLLRVMANP